MGVISVNPVEDLLKGLKLSVWGTHTYLRDLEILCNGDNTLKISVKRGLQNHRYGC